MYCDQSFRNQFLKKIQTPPKRKTSKLHPIHENGDDNETELKFILKKTRKSDPYHGNSIGVIEIHK